MITTDELTANLKDPKNNVFDANGRFYPCKECASGIYLTNPVTDVSGGWLTLRLSLGGGIGPLGIFPIHGDLLLYAVPSSSNNVVSLDGLLLEVQSDSFLVQLAQGAGLEQKLLDQLKSKGKYDLTAKLTAATQEVQQHFPITWGGACLDVDVQNLSLEGVYTLPEKKAVEVRFLASLKVVESQACQQSGIRRVIDGQVGILRRGR